MCLTSAALSVGSGCAGFQGAINSTPRAATCRLLSGFMGGAVGNQTYWCSKREMEPRWLTARTEAMRGYAPESFAELDPVQLWIVDAKPDAEYVGLYTGRHQEPKAMWLYVKADRDISVSAQAPVLCHELAHHYELVVKRTPDDLHEAALLGENHFVDAVDFQKREPHCKRALRE
jgi:hypothetical protein